MTGAKLGHHETDKVEGFFDTVLADLVPIEKAVAARAADLRSKRKSLRMPDALILATADLDHDIDAVLCADVDWPKVRGLSCRVELVAK